MTTNYAPTVNYHLTKACNMGCHFCYGTFHDVTSKSVDTETSKQIIEEIASSGFQKLTFAGGEPTLVRQLPELLEYAQDLELITCLVTNVSKLSNETYRNAILPHLDWVALSIDSVDPAINKASGRLERKSEPLDEGVYLQIAEEIKASGVKLKVNTVVSSYNQHDNLVPFINKALPERWKILQALTVVGQNTGGPDFSVSRDAFQAYIDQAKEVDQRVTVVPESCDDITDSYLMINPDGCFFDNVTGKYRYSDSILDVGIEKALSQVSFDLEKFKARGGEYTI